MTSYSPSVGCIRSTLIVRTLWHDTFSRCYSASLLKPVLKSAFVWILGGDAACSAYVVVVGVANIRLDAVLFLKVTLYTATAWYRCPSISRLAISRIFDKSDFFWERVDFRLVKSDSDFNMSDIFRRKSELRKARKTANALLTACSRPFYGATPPTDAPEKEYRFRKKSETC